MHQGLIVPLDPVLALKSRPDARDLKLPLADSVILATARTYLAVIWTQDTHFKGLEGVRDTGKGNVGYAVRTLQLTYFSANLTNARFTLPGFP